MSLEGGVDPKSAGPFQETKDTHPVSDAKSLGPYVVADVVDSASTRREPQPQSGSGGNNLTETATAAAEGVAATFGAVIPKVNEGEAEHSAPRTVNREEEPPQLGLRDPEGSYGAADDKKPHTTNLTQAARDAAHAADDKAARAGEKTSAAARQASAEAGKAGDWAREKTEKAGDGAGKAAGWVRKKASEASETVQGTASGLGRDAADTKWRATGSAQDAAESTKGKASEVSSMADDKLGRVKAAADESAERGGKRVAEGIEATQDHLESGKEKVRQAMSDPLSGIGAGTTSQGDLHDAAVDAQRIGEERRQSVIDKAKELGSSITNSLSNLGRSAAGNAGDGANEEAGLTVQEREEAARFKDSGHGILDQVIGTASVPYRYVAEIAERFSHGEHKHIDDVGDDKIKRAADSTESAIHKLQESLHDAGEKIQEGITPTSREDALLSAGVIPSNTQDILTAKHEE
jgi:hypothetical protein